MPIFLWRVLPATLVLWSASGSHPAHDHQARTPVHASADDPKPWRPFKSTEGRYSVQFPSDPLEKTYTGKNDGIELIEHHAIAIKGQSAFYVMYLDWPVPAEAMQKAADEPLAWMRDSLLSKQSAKKLTEMPIKLREFPGLAVTAEGTLANVGKTTISTRIFVVQNRIYVVSAWGTLGSVSDRDTKQFLDSFSVDASPKLLSRHDALVSKQELEAAFALAKAAVERELSIHFDKTVVLRVVDESQIAVRIAQENLPLLKSRGIMDVDAERAARSIGQTTAKATIAMFSWSTGEILVSSTALGTLHATFGDSGLLDPPFIHAVMVHELIHADDFRRFAVERILIGLKGSDAVEAFSAVLEGHAQVVAKRICAENQWHEGFDCMTAVIQAIPEAVPSMKRFLESMDDASKRQLREQCVRMALRYLIGQRFMIAVESHGGAEAVARVFSNPPTDMTAVYWPELYDPDLQVDSVVANLLRADDKGNSLLCKAVRENDLARIRVLLAGGEPQDVLDLGLVITAGRGYASTAELLLVAGADPNRALWPTGHTSVITAIRENHLDTLRVLLDHRGNPNAPDRLGWSPLHHTVDPKYERPDAVRLLVEHGAIVDYRNSLRLTALHRAASLGYAETVRVLLSLGADPSLQDKQGRTAGEWAAAAGYREVAAQIAAQAQTVPTSR